MAEALEPNPDCPSCIALAGELRELRGLRKVVEKLSAEVERLQARKAPTSRTSSKPPSSDAPWSRTKPPRKNSGKKRGGQPGRGAHQRRPAPPEDVDEVHSVKPDSCSSCSAPLSGDDTESLRDQIVDTPPIVPHIVEYQLHRPECSACGKGSRAPLPDGVHPSLFGPNLTALIRLLTGHYRMSRRAVRRFVADTYSIDLALRSISNMERRISEGLAAPHAEAAASVVLSAMKHLDETTWRQQNKLSCSGVVIPDRFVGYSFVDLEQRQVCLAHLVRDFRRMAEGEKAQPIGPRSVRKGDQAP